MEQGARATMNPLSVWLRRVQQGALWVCCRILGRPLRLAVFGAALYVCAPWISLGWLQVLLWSGVTLLMTAMCTSEPVKAGSTLAQSVVFGYRRARIHRKLHGWFIHAELHKKPNTELQVARHGGVAHEVTPKVAKRYTRRTPCGISVVVQNNIGKDHIDIAAKAHSVQNASGAMDLFVEPSESLSPWDRLVNLCGGHRSKKHWTQLDFVYRDPFKATITTSMLPPPSAPDRVVIGLDERSRPVEKNYKLPQLLAGESGSGKSTEVRMQLLGLVRSRMPFITMVFDPKKQEYSDIKNKAFYYQNDNNIDVFLRKCLEVLAKRQRELADLGLPDCPVDDPRFPYIIILIDELITALAGMDKKVRNIEFDGAKYNAEGAFMVLLSTGRGAKVIPIANTQLLQKAILELIRDLFPYKSFLRQPSIDSTRIAFPGEGMARQCPAHELPREGAEGIAWMETEGRIVKYRGALPSKAERQEVTEGIWYWTQVCRHGTNPGRFTA